MRLLRSAYASLAMTTGSHSEEAIANVAISVTRQRPVTKTPTLSSRGRSQNAHDDLRSPQPHRGLATGIASLRSQ